MDEFELISVHYNASYGPGLDLKWELIIWQTSTQKSGQSEHVLEMNENDDFSAFSYLRDKSIFSFFVNKVGLLAPHRSDCFFDENTDPSECFSDRRSLCTHIVWSGRPFLDEINTPYMELLFSSKNGHVGPICTVPERTPVPKRFRRVNIFTLKNDLSDLGHYTDFGSQTCKLWVQSSPGAEWW